MDTRKLLFRGDDAGVSRGTNEALLTAARDGVIRNIGLMAPTPEIRHAAEIFLPAKLDVCFGLHATLNAEWEGLRWKPVLSPERVPSLVEPDGSLARSTQMLNERPLNLDEMEAEITAQIALVRSLGFHLDYLDTHMCFTWIPGVEARLETLCRREGLVFDTARLTGPWLNWRANGAEMSSNQLIRAIESASPGSYALVFHPSLPDAQSPAIHHFGQPADGFVVRQRELETQILTSPELLSFCQTSNVSLVKYSELF